MRNLPTSDDLQRRDGLVPTAEICDRIAEALRGVAQHHRDASVTCGFKIHFDSKTGIIDVSCAVKAKRPVKAERNEEVLGEELGLFLLRPDEQGQLRLEDAL